MWRAGWRLQSRRGRTGQRRLDPSFGNVADGKGIVTRITEVAVIRSLVTLIYLVVGVVVARSHDYFAHLHGVSAIVSAILAVVLWPIVLFGANLHLSGLPKVKVKTKH
jgi:hypothetical protein